VIVPFRPGGGNRAEREELFAQLPAPIRATCHAQTSGTTAQSWDLDVLYYGRHVALIHHRGCSYSASGGQRYASGWVERVRIGRTALCSYSGYQCDRTEKVHDGEDGRLTEAHLATLIRDAREYDAQYPALREAEQAQITAREERIAEVQQAQTAYWEAVAQQAEAVGGKAIISTFGDDPVLSKHYHLNCAELVESKGRVEIGPLIVHMHARYEVASGKGGEWEVTRVDVKPDAIPSSDPLALLAALPALSFLNADA
jgi:hypothetical protein